MKFSDIIFWSKSYLQIEVWTLIIVKSTVIHPFSMVLFPLYILQLLTDNHKKYMVKNRLRLFLDLLPPRLGNVEHLQDFLPEQGIDLKPKRLYWLTDRWQIPTFILKRFVHEIKTDRWQIPWYIFFVVSRTPHESLPLKKGAFRQFFRLVTSQVRTVVIETDDLMTHPGWTLVRGPLHPKPAWCEAWSRYHQNCCRQQI